MFPGATPTGAPAVYAFGCGNCHPLDYGHHLDGVVDVELHDAAAPAGSLKSLASPTAAYDRSTGTCSGVYCHSTGQKTPTYKTTPSWSSATHLACNDCHDNPPRYASGTAGSDTANTHLVMADDGWELGHFSGLPGPWHSSKHGAQYGPGDDSAPITCQSCHFETTDPANTAPGSFYYLDTTGDYHLPGGDATRLTSAIYLNLQCTACHKAGGAPVRSGKVLPLRHVNGKRDIVFDPRSSLPALSWLPAAPNSPTKPYWATAWNAAEFPSTGAWNGTTVSFDLTTASYDPATKTCANVGCHLVESRVVWGTNPVGWATCGNCHSW
jgi:predicted CxxxxCH...CXXCH cytochrome family protein